MPWQVHPQIVSCTRSAAPLVLPLILASSNAGAANKNTSHSLCVPLDPPSLAHCSIPAGCVRRHCVMPPTGLPCFVSRPRCASRLAAVHGSNDTSAIVNVAARVTYRSFYSGLDESRVHRLRRSGITFNRPRGRDTFSVAFESRLRIVPLTQMSDLYGPIDASLITAVNADDPTSSAGNPLEQKKFMAGDAHIRRVVERKRRDEARLREKQDWHVLVVDPIELAAAAAPVPFPSPHPAYYQDWPTTASAASTRPPRASWRVLEQREASPYGDPSLPFFASADATTTTATVGEAAGGSSCLSEGNVARPFASSTASLPSNAYFYRPRDRRHLQQSGDTTLLAGTAVREITLHLPHPDSTPSHPLPPSPHAVRQRFYTAVCVDPDIHHDRFHREEAQVEMISAYRNILYEAAELATPAESGMNDAGSLRRSSATTRAAPFVADVVRVPALCQYSCGGRFLHELGKLNQQSVIKGFHRLSNEAKEELITNRCFTVEIYVPPLLLEQFEKAFLEEAWEAPTSTLNPGRTALYPGLAPPRTLLQYDGWIGKRAELIEAVETGGRSLLSGVKHALDGTPIEEKEVLPNLRVFGAREEQQRMLEGERRTAAAALDTPPGPSTYAPLRAGLQDDAAGRDDENGKTK